MNRFFKIALLCLAVVLMASPIVAQEASGNPDAAAAAQPISKGAAILLGGAVGAGLVILAPGSESARSELPPSRAWPANPKWPVTFRPR